MNHLVADYDVVVIGSGFGGSVTALRLTEKGYSVGILEAGRRFGPTDFPKSNWNLRRFLWFPRLGMYGIQRIDLLQDVLVLSGAGVGGGSLVYANTLYEPHDAFFTDEQWATITDWRSELAPFYAIAGQMLGVTEAPADTPADDVIKHVAAELGGSDTFRPTPVGVFLGEPGIEVDDPYFGGASPRRAGCKFAGGCMVGCRHNAKNSLDKNYLYLAEANGAGVHATTEAVDLRRLPSGRWEVTTRRPGPLPARRRRFTADHVVFSAGALGTTRLLLELRDRGRLPGISPRLGHLVRTNSEILLGATARSDAVDYSQGLAITSSIHPEPQTHIEPVRYPKGSSAMGLLGTVLTDGGPGVPRPLRYLGNALRNPVRWLRSLSVRKWAERSVILLVMQSYDNSLEVFRKRGWLRTKLSSRQGHGAPNPTYLPIANEAARAAAAAMDGDPMSAINEVLLNRPITAHILGGAVIAADPTQGVVDPYHRVFGHAGLHVIDGAAVGANLGVNPSLSITAMAERATAMWPNKGAPDRRPPLGAAYATVAAIAPRAPAVAPGVLTRAEDGRELQVRVAEARPEDDKAFASFFWKAYREAGPDALGFTGANDDVIAEITQPATFRARIGGPERRMFLAWAGNEVVGFAATTRLDATTVELAGIIVRESMTGRGAGGALVHATRQASEASGYRWLVVKTERRNTRAIGFYRRHLFSEERDATVDVGDVAVPVVELRLRLG